MLLLLSQSMTNAVTAALAAATMPICAVALEVAFDGKRLTLTFLAGVALVVLGGLTASGIQFGDFQLGLGFFDWFMCLLTFCLGFASNGQGVSRIDTSCEDHRYNPWHDRFLRVCVLWCAHFQNAGHTIPTPTNNDFILLLIYAWCALGLSQWMWIRGVGQVGIGVASFHLNAAPFYVMLIMLVFGIWLELATSYWRLYSSRWCDSGSK